MKYTPISGRWFIVVLSVLVLLLPGTTIEAEVNKSGVSPNVLSLPSGPGSIEGLGESFQANLNTGTSSYRIPLASPPGRAGFGPELALSYNSGYSNGPFGLAWRLDIPFIQRQTEKGQPFYTEWPQGNGVDGDHDGEVDDYEEFDTFMLSDGTELVPTTDMLDGKTVWRCSPEERFVRILRLDNGGWQLTQPDGSVLIYGAVADARIQATGPDGSLWIYRWYVESITDRHQNRIAFTYERLAGDSAQAYLKSVTYNGGMAVEFDYELRPDIITDYRPRFELRTSYRCTQIRMSESSNPIRTYRLSYAPIGAMQPLSLLAAVTVIGRDGSSELPPAEFTYTAFDGTSAMPFEIGNAPGVNLQDPDIELIDLNADALPDILDTRLARHAYYLNLGPAQGGAIRWSGYTQMEDDGNQPQVWLRQDTSQLGDIDGNANTDLLELLNNEVRFYTIGARLNWERRGSLYGAGFSFSDAAVRLVDANHDRFIDVQKLSGSTVITWISLKAERWSAPYVTPSPNANLQFDRQSTRLADMNGDRIADLVYLENNVCYYHPGKGYGQYGDQIILNNPPSSVSDPARLFLADVNGDGMSDAIYLGNAVQVWINQGFDPANPTQARFAAPFSIATPLLTSMSAFRRADINGNGSWDLVWNFVSGGYLKMAFLDFALTEQPYQLKTITNGIGRLTTVEYRTSVEEMIQDQAEGRPWPEVVPIAVPVVGKIHVYDGVSATYTRHLRYHDGYYNSAEEEFRGFAKAEQIEQGDASIPALVTAYTYHLGIDNEELKGKPLTMEAGIGPSTLAWPHWDHVDNDGDGEIDEADELDPATLFSREEMTWETKIVAASVPGEERQAAFPNVISTLKTVYELGHGDPVQTKIEAEYDDYGNLTRKVEHGRLDEGWNDERVTEATYTAAYPDGRNAWILHKPVTQKVTGSGGQIAAQQEFYYDDAEVLGAITKGDQTRTRSWVQGEEWVWSGRSVYDDYGNVVRAEDPLYDPANPAAGHYREITYDTTYHTFPEQETIYTGNPTAPTLSISATYDYVLGVVASSTDFNGTITTYAYDTFGRLTAITKPPDRNHTVEYDYVLAADVGNGQRLNWVETRLNDGSADGLRSRTYYNGLGEAIMTRAEGEDGQVVVSDTMQLNARKLPWKQYLPYFENGTLDYADPSYQSGFTEHYYDALGREEKVYQPAAEAGGDRVFSEISYTPFASLARDEEQTNAMSPHFGNGKRLVTDGFGQLREVYEIVNLTDLGEPGSVTEWKTTYDYNALGKLTTITDVQDNLKRFTYDGLGRMMAVYDPNRGALTYGYDVDSNLIRTQDAKGQVRWFTYDGVNRMLAEFDGADATAPTVEYHYDLPAGPVELGASWAIGQARIISDAIVRGDPYNSAYDTNSDGKMDVADAVYFMQHPDTPVLTVTARHTLGRLAWVRDASGEEHTSYDARGRTAWVVKRIQEPTPAPSPEGMQNFYTGMAYDAMDRVTQLTYPDLSTVSYRYNNRGLLAEVPGVISNVSYNPTGQNEILELANGVRSTYTYDYRLRLSHLQTVRPQDQTVLQNLTYTFDGVSNITNITDGRTDSMLTRIGAELGLGAVEALKFNGTQSFLYDALYRLIQAQNVDVFGILAYRYDRIGNLVRQEGPDPQIDFGAMTYGIGAGPHALTGTGKGPDGPQTFSYDTNGNLTTLRSMTLTWDSRDQLDMVQHGSTTATYTYDYAGRRTRKSVVNAETGAAGVIYYVDKFSEVRDGQLIKYVYAGANRVARSDSIGVFQVSGFYVSDHLGSTSLTLSATGAVQEQFVNYPYGQPRVEAATPNLPGVMPYTFIGKERDAESGLHYVEARYLSGPLGRFISVDPLTLTPPDASWLDNPQILNVYAYSLNNPLKYLDAAGKIPTTFAENSTSTADFFSYCFENLTRPETTNALVPTEGTGGGLASVVEDLVLDKTGKQFVDEILLYVPVVGQFVQAAKVGTVIGQLLGKLYYSVTTWESTRHLNEAIRDLKAQIWKITDPFKRGRAVEAFVAAFEYDPWENLNNVQMNFPNFDFCADGKLISLKSVNTNGRGWKGNLQKYIRDMNKYRGTTNGQSSKVLLDLRVQPGGLPDIVDSGIIEYGEKYNVEVIPQEF